VYPYERLAIAYFVALAILAPLTYANVDRKRRTGLVSLLIAGGIYMASRLAPETVRVWLPHAYLITGYWLPGGLSPSNSRARFEAWLHQTETAWQRHVPSIAIPGWTAGFLELSYLLCYVLVPAAFFVTWYEGDQGDVGRFWVAVLLAGYACYLTLPWLAARPPRLLDRSTTRADSFFARVNAHVLARYSHQLITFPSGHVAIATAAALSVLAVSPPAGVAMAIMAASIAIGAAAGQYHFKIELVLGVLVGVAGWLASG
jgi:hypothetical protein